MEDEHFSFDHHIKRIALPSPGDQETLCEVAAGLGINFTCVSYSSSMDFGIMVDPELAPQYADLATGLEEALAEYMALCKPKKKAPRKSRPSRARKKASSGKRLARKSGARKNPAG